MNSTLKNDLLLRALLRQPTPRRPVWLMRQAGRYLPEYRATRARAGGFLEMCTNPEIACEVTLQPVDRFPLDAAILFSDILTIPHAMNLGLQFETGEGPKFERPVRSAADIDRLRPPDPGLELKYVIDAVALVRRELNGRIPLIGFAGSPWTVATYMVEGGGSKTFGLIKRMMYEHPLDLHRLLRVLTQSTILYLNAQIAAGAQAVMLFDTWGGVLTPAQYAEFSLRYMAEIVGALTREAEGRRVPNIVFTKGGGPMALENRGNRLRRRGRRLDHRPSYRPARRRRPGGAARQLGPLRPVGTAGNGACRNIAGAGELRRGVRACL